MTDDAKRDAVFNGLTPSENALTTWLNEGRPQEARCYTWELYRGAGYEPLLLCKGAGELKALVSKTAVESDVNKVNQILTSCKKVEANLRWEEEFSPRVEPPTPLEDLLWEAYGKLAGQFEETPTSEELTRYLNEGKHAQDHYEWTLYHDDNGALYLACSKDRRVIACCDGAEVQQAVEKVEQILKPCKKVEAKQPWIF